MTRSGRRGRLDPWIAIAVAAFFALLVLALFGERLAPHETIHFVLEHPGGERPFDPGLVYPFGSDVLGRDIVSLVLAGARATLTIVLLAGMARVIAGVLVAAIGSWWRPTRFATEAVAELFSSIPATLVALLLVKIFVKTDTSILVFIGTLLVIGWAGPYRVILAEVDRLRHASFTEGALAMGVGRWRLFWRHHVPHLVPVLAINLGQQIVAALVLVAELGVLGVLVGPARLINVEESLGRFQVGPANTALIADQPEWGGLLAGSRTISALWTTRWLILVPGLAFALTAIAVAAIGFAIARRYARRDLLQDLRSPASAALAAIVIALFVASGLVPERYAEARQLADAARADLASAGTTAHAFSAGGLVPLAPGYTLTQEFVRVEQTGPARVAVAGRTVEDEWPGKDIEPSSTDPIRARSFVVAGTGGGTVEAPLVFAGRGIVPAEIRPRPQQVGVAPSPDLGTLVAGYADDYAGIDVRGKVVVLVRFLGVASRGRNPGRNNYALGPSPEDQIAGLLARGPAAVLYVDPALPLYTDGVRPFTYAIGDLVGGTSPYLRLERDRPALDASGVPVIVLSGEAAQSLVLPLGLDLGPFLQFDDPEPARYATSPARELGVNARVELPLAVQRGARSSFVGAVAGTSADAGHIVVWAKREPEDAPGVDVVAALARTLGSRGVPFVLVDFDPRSDPKAIRALLEGRRIGLVVVIERLDGTALRLESPYGDLIPAFDHYAARSGARHEVTRTTASMAVLSRVAPFADVRTVVIRGNGGDGDLRADAAALIAYLAGRYALGAPEVPR